MIDAMLVDNPKRLLAGVGAREPYGGVGTRDSQVGAGLHARMRAHSAVSGFACEEIQGGRILSESGPYLGETSCDERFALESS